VVHVLRYYENPSPVYLILGAISAALLFATKETAIISLAVLVIALFCTLFYRAIRRSLGMDDEALDSPVMRKKQQRTSGRSGARSDQGNWIERAGGPQSLAVWLIVALGVFLAV